MTFHQKPRLGMQLNRKHKLAKGLVSCWVMNEKTGDKIFDLSGNSNHGTNNGADWIPEGLDFVAANTDYVSIPKLFSSPNELSWSIRFKSNVSNTTEQRLIAYNNDGVFFITSINGGTANLIRTYISPAGWSDSTTAYDVTEWHNIVGTVKENDSLELYVDGVRIGDGLATGSFDVASGLNRVIGCGRSLDSWSNGIIANVIIYNRVLSANEIIQLNREPYAMFKQPMAPASLYTVLVDFATDLLHGKITIKDSTTNLVDGKVKVQDINTDLADSKVQVKDSATGLSDGVLIVQDKASGLVDGKVQIQDSTTNLVDGKVIVSLVSAETDQADGKIRIKDVTTGLVDGLIKVKDSVTGLADGKIKVSNIGSNLADGLIRIKDTVTNLADGKIIIAEGETSTNLFNGLLRIKDKATGIVDGLLRIIEKPINLADSKIILVDDFNGPFTATITDSQEYTAAITNTQEYTAAITDTQEYTAVIS